MITFTQKGDFSKLDGFMNRLKGLSKKSDLDKYGQRGVDALSAATPYDTGNTAGSWYYKINREGETLSLEFCNSNVNEGVPIAIVLQYGHGTGTGGWVEGRDYINPAIQPIFDEILNDLWKEVCQ
jgi:hypothetical protein